MPKTIPLTLGDLRRQTAGYPDDYQLVVTVAHDHGLHQDEHPVGGPLIPTEDEPITFYLRPDVNHGWAPSNVIALELGEFATG